MGDFVQVVTIAGSEEEAQRIAAAVVEARLCACAQILGPIQSIYWWQGSVEKAKEWLCICKSNLGLYRELEAAIRPIRMTCRRFWQSRWPRQAQTTFVGCGQSFPVPARVIARCLCGQGNLSRPGSV